MDTILVKHCKMHPFPLKIKQINCNVSLPSTSINSQAYRHAQIQSLSQTCFLCHTLQHREVSSCCYQSTTETLFLHLSFLTVISLFLKLNILPGPSFYLFFFLVHLLFPCFLFLSSLPPFGLSVIPHVLPLSCD